MNEIIIRRTHLSDEEQETARLMRAHGEDYHIIAAHFGINQGRIAELLGPDEKRPAPPPDPQIPMDL